MVCCSPSIVGIRVVVALAASMATIGSASPSSITVATLNSPEKVKSLLARTKKDLKPSKVEDDWSWFKYRTEDCLEKLKLPLEFKKDSILLQRLFKSENYSECADLATKMEAMLPANIPTDYPFGEDFRSEWRSEIAKLRSYANDYQGAIADYTIALRPMPTTPTKEKVYFAMPQLGGHQAAAYGRAQIYAILGQKAKALSDYGSAPGYYWSGCGNCMEGESHYIHRMTTIIDAANSGPQLAELKLLRLTAGGYHPPKARLNLGLVKQEIKEVQSDAALVLGELFLRNGKKDLAKAAFEAVAAEGRTDNARMAKSRLHKL